MFQTIIKGNVGTRIDIDEVHGDVYFGSGSEPLPKVQQSKPHTTDTIPQDDFQPHRAAAVAPTVIKMADEFFPAIRRGDKTVTIRLGRKDFPLGVVQLVSVNGTEPSLNVQVTSVAYEFLYSISSDVQMREGSASFADLVNTLSRFYPDINFGSEVTIVRFFPIYR